jgi:Tol biopolymer transport system component
VQTHLVGRLLLCALCVLPGCGGDDIDPDLTGPGGGALEVITSTTGVPEDPDGYAVTVDDGAARSLAPNGADRVAGLSPGSHIVELAGIAGFCVLDGENPRTVEIAAGDSASVRFDITCDTPVLQVSVSTTGSELDPDGYGVSIDGVVTVSVLPVDTTRIPYVSSGPHTVALTGVAPNCAVSGEPLRTVDVVDGVGSVHLDVVCHIAMTLGVYVETSGGDPDPDGYVARVNGGSPVAIFSGPGFFRGGWFLPPGDYTVTLSDVAPHCRPSGSNTASATVTSGDTTSVNFTVSCGVMRTGRFGRDLLLDVKSDIYLLSADGSRFVNLTNHPDDEFFATFSPDGRKIAFASLHYVVDIPGPMGHSHWESHVFTMNPDGTGRTQLTDGYREEGPAWSPDGGRLAFIGSARDGTSHLFVMNADGSGQTPLASRGGASDFLSPEPAWSPDGTRIVYSGPVPAHPGIFVINADGSGETRLTDAYDAGAAWSPDGGRIAFVRSVIGQGDAIWVMNADGSALARVAADTGGGQHFLSWSPDGTKIAFELNGKVYLVNGNGSGLAQLTFGPYAYFPNWSPDGSKIAYYQAQEHETRLYLMELDGSGEVPLTPAFERGVTSSPAAGRP